MKPAATAATPRQPIGVLGLWHLGSVTAACLAEAGSHVLGVDPDHTLVEGLAHGRPPVAEPGLRELLSRNASRLRFSTDPAELGRVRRAWVAFDTPVDGEDRADIEWVLARAERLLMALPANALVVVSSQLPVGSVARLRERCAIARGDGGLRFACVPENLCLGRALESFQAPDRIVAGVRNQEDRRDLAELLAPFSENVQWMGVESAEMTKHALNGFLATSIAFMNDVASICELEGADAAEVAHALKSERRIGPRAYLDPGDAFAGGTLARDIGFLAGLARRHNLPAHVFTGVADDNAAHRHWTRRKLLELVGEGVPDGSALAGRVDGPDGQPLAGRTVAIWGLTYKPGTDTLRRSSAVELCRWLLGAGAALRAHDPAVKALPPSLPPGSIEICSSPLEAAAGADALVLCTAWPDYREVPIDRVVASLSRALVIDPAGLLADALEPRRDVLYVRVGAPLHEEVPAAAGPPRAGTARPSARPSARTDATEVARSNGPLAGRTALITGGSRGLGLQIARAYLAAGARGVCICGRDPAALARASEELRAIAGPQQLVQAELADVSAAADVERLVASVLAGLGELTILVSNAGVYGPMGPIERTDWAEWVRAIEINLFGSVLPARAVAPHFVQRGYGKIIQLSGGGATGPLPGLSAYAASKAAAVRFAETLAQELRAHHIDVNAVAPGALNTRMLDEVLAAGPERVGEDFYRRALEQRRSGGVPLWRAAELVVFLGSAAGDGITGKLLSAVWDPWSRLPDHLADLDSDVYTLRRIVPGDRGFDWGEPNGAGNKGEPNAEEAGGEPKGEGTGREVDSPSTVLRGSES